MTGEAMEAIVARRRAAEALTAACKARLPAFVQPFAGVLAEPVPDDMRRVVRVAERRVRK